MAGQVIQGDEDQSISDINVVPLTDVMLVLLIVFLITTQVIKQAVPIKLPAVRYEPTTTKPDNVSLTVRNGPGGTCEVYWLLKRVSRVPIWASILAPIVLGIVIPFWGVLLAPPLLAVIYAFRRPPATMNTR